MIFLGFIIYLILSYWSIGLYEKKDYKKFIFIFYILVTDGVGTLSACPLHGRDSALAVVVLLLCRAKLNGRKIVDYSNNVDKSIVLLLWWFVIRTIVSIMIQEESILNAILVLRFELFFLCYFIFKKISWENIKGTIPLLFVTTCLGGLYLICLSLFGNEQLAVPPGAFEICLLISILDKRIKHRRVILAYFLFLLLLGTSRGLLIALALALSFYYMTTVRKSLKFSPQVLLFAIVIILVIMPLFINKLSEDVGKGKGLIEESGTVYDIMKNRTYDEFDHSMVYSEGTFAFRVGIVVERLDYLLNHPSSLIFGVGAIHEESAQKLYNFNLGTYRGKGEDLVQGQIDTGDVSYITELFRYGIIYLFLFFLLTKRIIDCLKASQGNLPRISYVLLIVLLIRSVSSVPFMGSDYGFYFILMVVAASNYKVKTLGTTEKLC